MHLIIFVNVNESNYFHLKKFDVHFVIVFESNLHQP